MQEKESRGIMLQQWIQEQQKKAIRYLLRRALSEEKTNNVLDVIFSGELDAFLAIWEAFKAGKK
jgi:hypothetical protein